MHTNSQPTITCREKEAQDEYVLLEYCWILLYTVGYCWVLLDTVGYCWVLLGTVGYCWILLHTVVYCWILLDTVGYCYILLYTVGYCWILLYRLIGSKFEMVRPHYSAKRTHNVLGHAHLPSPHTPPGIPALECYSSQIAVLNPLSLSP